MSRLTIKAIDGFIDRLSKTERVSGQSEDYKLQAIAYLNNYCRELEYMEKKSVKLKEGETDGSSEGDRRRGTV